MVRILVTGFEPFVAAAENPSGDCVAALRAEGDDGATAWSVLPVTWAGAARALVARADREAVRGCLMFGLATGAKALRVEGAAYNQAAAPVADNAGFVRGAEMLRPDGPGVLRPTGLEVGDLVVAMAARGVSVEASDDPGRFVCNALYYAALSAGRPWSPYSVFVHVPPRERDVGVALQEAVRRTVEVYRAALARALTGGDRGR